MIHYITIFLLSLIIVFIIDVSGFIDSVKSAIYKLLFGKNAKYSPFSLKPIDCSLCMTFWVGFLYLALIPIPIDIYLSAFIVLNSFLASTYANLLIRIRLLLERVIDMIG